MSETTTIACADGACPATVFTQQGKGDGPWPGVIFYMDGLGIRPALHDMAQRIADMGYLVPLPDMFYRTGPYEPFDPKEVFASGGFREKIGHHFSAIDPQKAASDTEAFLAYLDGRGDMAGRKLGATGYCMGGAMVLSAAGTYPDRFGAAASFHGGNLASDAPTSPHLLVPRIEAQVYIGAAIEDSSYPPEMEEALRAALDSAGTTYVHVTYEGCHHGWTMPDFPVFDAAGSEQHFNVLEELFAEALGG